MFTGTSNLREDCDSNDIWYFFQSFVFFIILDSIFSSYIYEYSILIIFTTKKFKPKISRQIYEKPFWLLFYKVLRKKEKEKENLEIKAFSLDDCFLINSQSRLLERVLTAEETKRVGGEWRLQNRMQGSGCKVVWTLKDGVPNVN